MAKNILIVDDVFTTGSTIRAAIDLVKQAKPKNIKVLVMAKTVFKDEIITQNAKSIEHK